MTVKTQFVVLIEYNVAGAEVSRRLAKNVRVSVMDTEYPMFRYHFEDAVGRRGVVADTLNSFWEIMPL